MAIDDKDVKSPPDQQQGGGDNNNNEHNRHRWQQGHQNGGLFKCKTKEITDNIFDNTGQHDAAMFNKSLKNIANHLQLELGNDVSKAVHNMIATVIDILNTPNRRRTRLIRQ